MRLKVVAILFVGTLMAVLSGLATFSYTRGLEAEVASVRRSIDAFGETRAIPVAARDIKRGAVVAADDFTTLVLPVSAIPGQALTELPQPAEGQSVVAMEDLHAGDLLLRAALALADAGSLRELSLGDGVRVYRLNIANLGEHLSGLRKGHMVDIFWVRSQPRGGAEARLIGAGLRLFALPAEEAGTEIMVEVSPADVARILAAGAQGSFHLTRSSGPLAEDATEVVVSDADLAGLPLAVRAAAAPDAAAAGGAAPAADMIEILARAAGKETKPQVCVTAVVRAGNRSFIEIPC